jgi:hypothetical protein
MDTLFMINRTNGVMVGVISSSAVDRGLEPQSDQTYDYTIENGCSSFKSTALRRKGKEGFAQNQDNVSWWSYTTNVSTRLLLLQ